MLKVRSLNLLISSVIAVMCSLSSLSAQTDNIQIPVLKATALKDFDEGRYEDALEKYESLLTRYPRDGVFHYYQGVCLLHLNRNLDTAAESLKFASTRPNMPSDVYYYLGLVYMKTYQFVSARISFEKFTQSASRQELRALDSDRQLANVQNALDYTKDYNSYEVIATSFFSFTDSMYTRQVRSTGGKLVKKPDEFLTSGEKSGELTNYMFLPKVIDNGDYVYFSGYSRSRKAGSELFRVKYLNGKRWGKPELLSSLNTGYDEVLPYFDPVGKDLYFASKGHSGMGGFDVFKSHYDEVRNTWSDPVNLGFPLNSPYDDLLLIPGSNLGSVFLVTERQGRDSFFAAYKLQIREPRKSLAGVSPKELERIGNMGGIKPVFVEKDIFTADLPEAAPENKIRKETKPAIEPVKDELTLMPPPYNNYLRQALQLQFSSDSLARLAGEARLMARDIADPNRRWELQKEIIEWEKNSRDLQSRADEYYMKIKEIESSVKPQSTYPPTIKPDTVLDGLKVYRYTNEMQPKISDTPAIINEIKEPEFISVTAIENGANQTTDAPAENPLLGEPGGVIESTINNESVFNRFVILEKSPYSESNPFPRDMPLPDGSFYQIQLGVFSQQVSYDGFGGITPVTGETVQGRNMIRYYAGKFNQYEVAVKALETIKKMGYNDAFIVSWYNGQKMPAAKVWELEKRP